MRIAHILVVALVVSLYAGPASAQDALALGAPAVAARASVDTSPERVATRIALGTLAGWGSGMLGGSLAAGLAFTAGGCFDQLPVPPIGCGIGLAGGGFVGLVLGAPLGALGVSDLLRGGGSYGGSLLGALAGTALAGLVFALASGPILEGDDGGLGPMLALSSLPALGASIAVELETAAR